MDDKRDIITRFLETERRTQSDGYEKLARIKASVLKAEGKVFVGKFVGIKGDSSIFKVRMSEEMPRKNTFWTGSLLNGEMSSYKNWGNLSWWDLRAEYQENYTDAHCIWLSKSDDPQFGLVGIRGITMDFDKLLEEKRPIIAFGPKTPPLKYLSNLIELVQDTSCEQTERILCCERTGESLWKPILVKHNEDLNILIRDAFKDEDTVAIQGPPGTGKTFRMASLAAELLAEGNSVLATALTNEALMVLAKQKSLSDYLKARRISKTSMTRDEQRTLPELQPNMDNSCDASSRHLSLATFYVSSGWAVKAQNDAPYDYVIMDEASQALLPMLAATKKLGRKVVWIGDQKQLAPIVETNEDLCSANGWMPIIKGFDTVCNNIPMPAFMLSDTFRLTKRGAGFTGIFYDNSLSSASQIQFVNTDVHELNTAGGPVMLELPLATGNKKPANAIAEIYKLVSKILAESPKAEIAILAKFKESVKAIQTYFIKEGMHDELPDNIRIETVDRIQGMTVDYVFYLIPNASLKYSLKSPLFNVATSRARLCTIIVADPELHKNSMPDDVRRFLLKLDEDKVATFSKISSGDIHVTVIGRIDLPQKGFKEIDKDKENIFIIDTNVFVNCPSILSKIKGYPIVVPTTVLEELDRLKIKESVDKNNLNKATNSIKLAFMNNFSKMESGDASLLPEGFDAKKADCLILSVAIKYQNDGKNAILLTSDNLLQAKAAGLGITTISLAEFLSERSGRC